MSCAVSVKHCSQCDRNTEYYCHFCQLDLCRQCMENHSYTDGHYVTIYRGKFTNRQIKEKCNYHPKKVLNSYCYTCTIPFCIDCSEHINHKIENILRAYDDLSREQRSILIYAIIRCKSLQQENISNVWISYKIANIRSTMLLKAKKMNDFLEEFGRDILLTQTSLRFPHKEGKIMQLKHDIQQLYAFEHACEQLACKPVEFLRFIKRQKIKSQRNKQDPPSFNFADTPSSNLIRYLSDIKITKHEKKYTDNQTTFLALKNVFQMTGYRRLFHISLVTSSRVWVNCLMTLFLIDIESQKILEKITISTFDTLAGLSTVNNKKELIYINKDHEITGHSNDSKLITIRVKRLVKNWIPKSVYCAPSTGDLLVGMWIPRIRIGKIEHYDNYDKVTKSIEFDRKCRRIYSCPMYLAENKNYDIIASDLMHGVVVTDCKGNYRFSYTGPPSKPRIKPAGICADALSNILVCDCKSRTVQMIDRNGVFLKYLLTEKSPGIHEGPISLKFDSNTNNLWVGSFERVSVYNFVSHYTGKF